MQLQVVGLGRMDANTALRLLHDGHDVNGSDPNATARERTASSCGNWRHRAPSG